VTRFGVSVEKVVATILTPSSHQGMLRLAKKNDSASFPARRDVHNPIAREIAKYTKTIVQSNNVKFTGVKEI
jgi:hypothetical protein